MEATLNNKLIISDFYKNILFGFYFEDDKLQRLVNLKNDNVVGNIYCGYVKDVVKNINGAFVPVSYTHLDVYKRQIFNFCPCKGSFGKNSNGYV